MFRGLAKMCSFTSSVELQFMNNIHKKFLHVSCSRLKKKGAKSHSSQQWISRHLNDPFVKQARADNYRARSAYKLLEMNTKYRFLQPGQTVIDCGAAPGSWTQVAVERTNSTGLDKSKPVGTVIAVDLLHMQPVEGAIILDQSDFTDSRTQDRILEHLNGQLANTVLSDMAPNATGIRSMDHELIVDLVKMAAEFAKNVLQENGHFLGKLWDGHDTPMLKRDLGGCFRALKVLRPEASRKESSEIYIYGQGFKRQQVHPVR